MKGFDTYSAAGIELPPNLKGEVRALCPKCSASRKKSTARCLAVNTDKSTWYCHHCAWSGWLNGNSGTGGNIPTIRGATLQRYAAAKNLPVDFLEEIGLTDIKLRGHNAIRIPYFHEDGSEGPIRIRCALTGENRFRWRQGSKPMLYGLDRLSRKLSWVLLVEGESDCHTLWWHRFNALGLPGANHYRDARDAPHLASFSEVFVVIEPDSGSEALLKALSRSSIADKVRLVSLPQKDVSALFCSNPDNWTSELFIAMGAARPLAELRREQQRVDAATAWAHCQTLAEFPDILAEFVRDIEASGLVGESRNAQILYLALTSRFLSRPVSIVLKGSSSVGKSFTVEKTLSFFPEAAFYALTGMSEKALAYGEEPLQHRMLVIFEAQGMNSKWASYMIRSLLSEGRIRYEVAEKTSDGIHARMIEREGPTGLIVTTTAISLHPENETRMMTLTVKDTQEQTRAILKTLAQDAHKEVPREHWMALQTWLQSAEHRVSIPYAVPLSRLVPPIAVRLRRDFSTILSLIKAHAILHQVNRECDAEGRIIATINDDYAAVRSLVVQDFSDVIGATVPSSVREVVTKVREIGGPDNPVSLTTLANLLELDKSSASRRVKAAKLKGWLVDLQEKLGQPAMLVLGEALPEDRTVLPPPERVLQCCSVD